MIKKKIFISEEAYILENDKLKAVVLPQFGGKIASFYHKKNEFELLFQNKEKEYKRCEIYSNFADFDAAGFDDAFPSIDEGMVKYGDKEVKYPDHGEIWSAVTDCTVDGESLIITYKSKILPYFYKKIITLDDSGLHIAYEIKNEGEFDMPVLWAMHCLINCHKDMELIFPKDTKEVEVVEIGDYLGKIGTIHPFPITKDVNGNEYRLDRVFPKTADKYEKYYVKGKVSEGFCGAYYPHKNVTYTVKYDADKLPYLGFWVTEGGFRGDYNCALEPANGYYDSIAKAQENNQICILKPNEILNFDLTMNLE